MARAREGRTAGCGLCALLGCGNRSRVRPQRRGARRTQAFSERISGFGDDGAALQSLGDAAIAANQPAEAVAALDAYSQTTQRPALLLLRGEAREQAGKPLDAAADYQAVYLRFAISEQARQAATKLGFLRASLGANYPPLALDQRLTHAAMLFGAKSWNDARNEYSELMPRTFRRRSRARAIAHSGMRSGAGFGTRRNGRRCKSPIPMWMPNALDALAEYYRAQQQEPQMVAAVEGAVSRAPSSHWAESALFSGGELLLGAARSRPRGELLQAARGKFSDINQRRRQRSGAWRGPPF